MRSIALGAVALGWLALTACTKTMELEVQLTIPVAYQQTLTFPVQFAFETDLHRGSSETLCGETDLEHYIALTDDVEGCAQPLEVRVAVGPWTPPSTGCVTERGNNFDQVLEQGGTEIATAMAFEDYSASSCESASEIVRITLPQTE